MAHNWWGSWGWIGLASFVAIGGSLISEDCALAQIRPDSTLGPESSSVTPNVLIKGLPSDRIDGGARRGANLFHSFQEFNIDQGRGAYFTNPTGIENILSRVTGSNRSEILGTLGVLGNANLFLINPNGIIFGPNSSLDVRGSFVGTTANAVRLGDTGLFSASEPATSNLLTVRPSALFFNAVAAQGIVNQSQAQSLSSETNSLGGPVGLQVPTGNTLALVGGNVLLEGGNLTAAGGRIELGSVAGVGEVSLSQSGNNWSLGYDQVDALGDIRLEGEALVDVSGEGGGNLQIQGAQLKITQGSSIFADTLGSGDGGGALVHTTEAIALRDGSLITADVIGSGTGGDLAIATEAIALGDGSLITADVIGSGTGGGLTIATGRLTVQDGARVSANTFSTGAGGNLSVTAADAVEVIGTSADDQSPSGLLAQTEGDGDAGNLTITTRRLTVRDGAQVGAGTFSTGAGGNLSVTAADAVEVTGTSANGRFTSGLFTQTKGDGDADTLDGNAGNLTIATGRLTVRDGAQVSASTFGTGAGGNLSVTADAIELVDFGSGLFTQTEGPGAAGDLTIQTGRLSVRDVTQVSAGTLGSGSGGDLSVTADAIELVGASADNQFASGLFTSSEGPGAAGDLTIQTGRLSVLDGAQVSASTRSPASGAGPGGNLSVTADAIELVGTSENGQAPSGLFTSTQGPGAAGDLTIQTGQLAVRNRAEVSASSEGSGAAGDVDVTARSIRLDKEAFLSSETTAGQGNINLRSQDLILRRGSNITTDATGTATGGNITIDTGVLAALENSDISANALEGPGGRVRIDAQGIFGTKFREDLTPQSDITASSNLGPQFSGTVELNTPDVDPSSGLVALPEEVVDASRLIAQRCPAGGGNVAKGESEFVVTGRGGLPPGPSDPPNSDAVLAGWVTLDPKIEEKRSGPVPTMNLTRPTPAPLVEARGWVRDSRGQVVLTAQAPKVTPHSSGLKPAGCPGGLEQ